MMTDKQRTTRARIGAYTMHSMYDSRETSKRGRETFMARFEREVDREMVLTPSERLRRAEMAKKAYFTALAAKSAAKRSPRR